MTALAFDTYKAVKAFQAVGADESLAEAVVATVSDAVGGNVATKADLAEAKAELKTDIVALEARLCRHLWIMAASIIGLTVSLTVTLVRLTS